ncbi:uncharacterized protein LOC126969730 [Leptidea sinapis]|uniref:uncharacterized protein LOC126969730 n=1 Tax=Leptidea sinapis TaxID=189913 RepID=UPI00212CDF0F|nr:uncharacterized protein LOC126969730 [Leptidea sinapis]
MMNKVDNNQFEVKSAKRKINTGPNVYLNPALDILANEDPMCNNKMEVTPNKRRKRTKSVDIAAFENSALDLGISKAAVNEFLVRELQNVNKNMRTYETPIKVNVESNDVNKDDIEPIYANLTLPVLPPRNILIEHTEKEPQSSYDTTHIDKVQTDVELDSGISIVEQKSSSSTLEHNNLSVINNITNTQSNVNNQLFMNSPANVNLSFIDRLALDSPQLSNQSLYFDDDLNESNIMEIKTITIITKTKILSKKNTNPFLDPNLDVNINETVDNPFLEDNGGAAEVEYNDEPIANTDTFAGEISNLMPRRLFVNDTNSTISTVNEESLNTDGHEYENIEYRAESPVYENIEDMHIDYPYNKQSKILGCDVSHFNAVDIMNINKVSKGNCSNESNDSKKDLKHHILKASNKLSKKVFKTLKKKFKGEKIDQNVTSNPYEVPRKHQKQKCDKRDSGIENPGLKLDNSDDIEIEELCENEDEQYESIKTIRNTRLNTNVTTPLKDHINDSDLSHNKTYTPGKKVRFDSTLNREKVITGESFDCSMQSPGFDAKIDKYHDELENCINERKFIQQNM